MALPCNFSQSESKAVLPQRKAHHGNTRIIPVLDYVQPGRIRKIV